MIQPRQAVTKLKAYLPPLEGRREQIRLDFNENTSGFPDCYTQSPDALYTCYPEYQAFLSQLSQAWQVPESYILLTNGSDEALFLSAFTFIEPNRQDTALTMTPTFSLISHYLTLAGSRLIEVPYPTNFQYDTTAISNHLQESRIQLAMFASPDNPTGAVLSPETIQGWCQTYPDTLFVIDEAYAEYANSSALPLIQDYPNLLVTRTFSKAWGMAGLRLGALLGNPNLIALLQRVRSPYSVNALAMQTASQLLLSPAAMQQQAIDIMSRKNNVMEVVKQHGYQVIPGEANFFLMKVGLDANGFCEFFRQRGILLRNQSVRPGLEGWVRVSIGTQNEMDFFLEVLNEVRQKRVLIFDMDDTLIDTSRSFDATIALLVERYSGSPLAADELNSLRAQGGFNDDWEATAELLRRRGIQKTYREIADEAQSFYLALAPKTETWHIAPEVLAMLKQTYRLGVATGRCRREYEPIWQQQFSLWFEVVICQDDSPACAKKPSPELLQQALAQMGAESGLYVGNSVDDMQAAKAAGLTAIGIAISQPEAVLRQAGADRVFRTVNDLVLQTH